MTCSQPCAPEGQALSLESLVSRITQFQSISDSQIKIQNLKRKVSLFGKYLLPADMILCIENPPKSIRKLLELINKFGKVVGYKFNTQNSAAFLHTVNEQPKKELQKAISLIIASKRIKY